MGNCKSCDEKKASDVQGHVEHNKSPDEVNSLSSHRRQVTPPWTKEKGDKLQDSVDRVFGTEGNGLLGLEFSFTVADPFIEGCPLIGCSTGFTKLCGYEMDEIVGRNCRFLVDPVPPEKIDKNMRRHVRQFCDAIRDGKDYVIPTEEREDWMPIGRPLDELFCMQKNCRKDGTCFNNMFYLKIVRLGKDLGEEEPYIVGLQSELPEGKDQLGKLAQNHEVLDQNMDRVLKELAGSLFVQCTMRRQELRDIN